MDATVVTTSAGAVWPAPDVPTEASVYLAALAGEQQRYLAALDGRSGGLPDELVAAAASQVRLARSFLDAQRAILRHRAETQMRVAAMVAAPRPSALAPPTARASVALPAPERVGSKREAELAEMVDAVFDEPTAAAERELRVLLDGWWARERAEGAAALADARARVSARWYLDSPKPADPGVRLPTAVARALDRAATLDEVLATLSRVLDDEARPEPHRAVRTLELDDVGDAEQFDRFWKGGAASTNRGSVRNWLLVQIAVPMVSAASVLALVLAVVG